MVTLVMEVLLSKWIVFFMLFVAFAFVSRWALQTLREYAGYALGWMIGLFFVLVYVSLGGGSRDPGADANATLSFFSVFLATLFGVAFGGVVMVGLRFGMRYARGVALQVAFYTALCVILLFLVFAEGTQASRSIGIFALAFGIATLFALVIFPGGTRRQFNPEGEGDENGSPDGNAGYGNQPGAPVSRLDTIRQRMSERNRR